ncbi:MAG TPA: NAD(P)-binding protein [Rhodocyclaceae bacterium]|nr:NAD(P)-binding protein [Rhodocyclaceae bacterium]
MDEIPPMNRRDFLGATATVGALGLLNACGAPLQTTKPPLPPGELGGPNQHLGHRLRRQDFPAPDEVRHIPVPIVGGGVAGLSAAWRLHRAGMTDFMLLEMEAELGGNARAGRNEVSRYPLGAHYLPLPSREAVATRALLAELGVLLGDPHAAQPAYDEKYLCYAPQERLYIDGYWQEGLWPTVGVAAAERAQYAKFLRQMGELRREIDPRGRRAFASPMTLSSRDARSPVRWPCRAATNAGGRWIASICALGCCARAIPRPACIGWPITPVATITARSPPRLRPGPVCIISAAATAMATMNMPPGRC